MFSRVRFLITPLVASAVLWCSVGYSAPEEVANADSELNLSDEGVADDFFGYWNTYGCALLPNTPYCASAGAILPYFGPAWYNWGFGRFGGRFGGRHFRGR